MRISTAVACAALQLLTASAGSLQDIEHIVIFMQENRAFDHYYGVLRGVRGFGDRTVTLLPNGRPNFYQPISSSARTNGVQDASSGHNGVSVSGHVRGAASVGNSSDLYMLPWHVNTLTTSGTCMDAPAMNYECDIAMWNDGRMDSWNTARDPGMGMGHFDRTDLPYYYALADGFTIGDHYFQSTFTQTNPNRLHLFSGSNGLSAGAFPVLDNTEPTPGFTWPTYAESLEEAGISWKVYQQPDNFDDNAFAWFESFMTAQPGSALYEKGMVRVPDIVAAFGSDLANGTLPQVTWIIAQTNYSEHSTYHPQAGEALSSRLIAQLQKYPNMYAKTAFILDYDEQGGYYDHHHSPVPPLTEDDGASTVTTAGEVFANLPMGMGFRVPLMVISPWTRGGYVVSEVFDHTSVIRFVEERFGVTCPNISPWRRAMAGNLLSAFDFANPDYTWPNLPNTSDYNQESIDECADLPPPVVPAVQAMPVPEPGTRLSRPLPYQIVVTDTINTATGQFVITINNTGTAGAPFYLFDVLNGTNAPKKYAVEAGKSLTHAVNTSGSSYNYALHGANGFARSFIGASVTTPSPQASISYIPANGDVLVTVTNIPGGAAANFTIVDNVYGLGGPWTLITPAGATGTQILSVAASGNWYDFTVTISTIPGFSRRFMGRMETGKPSTSDPATTNPLHPFVHPETHPLIPDDVRIFQRIAIGEHKDAMY